MILTHESSFPSAMLLRDAICKEFGWDKKKLLVSKNPDKIKELHIRYGNSASVSVRNSGVPNYKGFIQVCSDKKFLAKALKVSSAITTPDFVRISQDLPSKEDFPFLIRETLTSSGSKGIVIFQEYEAFVQALADGRVTYNSYWTPYFDFASEFRVHLLGGKIGKIFRKEINDTDTLENIFIRNNDNSHFYRIKVEKTPEQIIKLAQAFHEYVQANFRNPVYFVALDIGIQKESGNPVFIEANSAPGLNESTAEIYAKYLIQHCNNFAKTEKEMQVAQELEKQTQSMKIDWALQF